jgi:NTE family protein
MPATPIKPKIALACQGGGSHAAFAAGALVALLRPETFARFDLVALSGTSGGAVCAALAWSGLLASGGDPAEASRRLRDFWNDLKVGTPYEWALNVWGMALARLPFTAEISPYLFDAGAERMLRQLLRDHVRLEEIPGPAHRLQPPKLLIAATDIREGAGRILCGEHLTYDDIIASAAVPPLFRATRTRGTWLWDGLFSRNPPIRAFTELAEKPDEIWVVQINPRRRETQPSSSVQIIDRRNELAGNLSLDRELDFIESINRLVEKYPMLREREGLKTIAVRIIELGLDLDYPSKLDRGGEHIGRLLGHGEMEAARFFDDSSLRRAQPEPICWTGSAEPGRGSMACRRSQARPSGDRHSGAAKRSFHEPSS